MVAGQRTIESEGEVIAVPVTQWETRSSKELRQAVAAGLGGGESFYGAVRELERRSAEMTRVIEDQALLDAKAQKRRALAITIALVVALSAAVLLATLLTV